jgi:DTW domain-containing protein YfiP
MTKIKRLKPLFSSFEESKIRNICLKFVNEKNYISNTTRIKVYHLTNKRKGQKANNNINQELLTTLKCPNNNYKNVENDFIKKIIEKIKKEKVFN